MNESELREAVAGVRWYHSIDLPFGIRTPGVLDPRPLLDYYGFPETFDGESVLDVGAWDGWFSFEAERRGAARVLATDSFVWEGGTWGSKAGFELARTALGSRVEDRNLDVLELSPEEIGTFDTVLFLGVLYHMRDPLLALERVSTITRSRAIIETHIDLMHMRRPALAFYGGDELKGDSSNWVGPNQAALVAMLRSVGFTRVEIVQPIRYLSGIAKVMSRRIRGRGPGLRVAIHAWK